MALDDDDDEQPYLSSCFHGKYPDIAAGIDLESSVSETDVPSRESILIQEESRRNVRLSIE